MLSSGKNSMDIPEGQKVSDGNEFFTILRGRTLNVFTKCHMENDLQYLYNFCNFFTDFEWRHKLSQFQFLDAKKCRQTQDLTSFDRDKTLSHLGPVIKNWAFYRLLS